MPTVQEVDTFAHGDFTVPGGAHYTSIDNTPTKDLTIVHPGDPASLLISTAAAADSVGNGISGSPTLPWHGYWYYLATADVPASDQEVMRLRATDGADGRLTYQTSSGKFYHFIAGGGSFPLSAVYPLDTWVWIEHILDTGSGTRTLYTRIAGADLSPATRVIAASTGVGTTLGTGAAGTITERYSNHYWGVASSISDWLGEPAAAAREYKRFYGPALLTGSAADLYTVPTGKRIRVLDTHVSNPSASAVDLTLSIGTDAAGTRVYDGLAIPADSRKDDFTPYELAAGEKIQGFASSAGVLNLTITGYEESV